MKTTYQEIVKVENIATTNSCENIAQIISLGQNQEIPPAAKDQRRVLLLAIDIQNDFMEGIGSLPVKGSKEDVARLTRWMYNNLSHLTQVICSLDCHSIMQIFHPNWWVNSDLQHPEPFTIITYQDVVNKTWRPVNGQLEECLDYLKNLELNAQKQLCIWPYHCLEGTTGAKLESEFTKMLYFHAQVRQTKPLLIYKGQNPYTEMYGIIKPEYDKNGYINLELLNQLELYDEIYIAGQASSHCVLSTVEQIATYFGVNHPVNRKIIILQDCMSSISGFQESTQEAFMELTQNYGIQIKNSTQVTL